MISEKLKEAELIYKKDAKATGLINQIFCFFAGFAFSLGSVTPDLHPFGISFVAVSKRKYLISSFIGATAGMLVHGIDESSIRYISSLIITAIGVFALSCTELAPKSIYSMVISFVSCSITGIILDFSIHSYPTQLLLTFGEAVLCSGSSFFFFKAINSDYRRLRLQAMPINDVGCIVITLSVMLSSLGEIRIFKISPARAVAFFAVLIALRYLGDRWGVMLSLCLGFTLSIGRENMLFLIGALAFSVMCASLFSSLGALATGTAFLLSFSFFCIASQSREALYLFIEAGLSSLLFMMIPANINSRLEGLFDTKRNIAFDGALRQSLVLKLRFAASAMAAISESVEQVRDRINDITRRENEQKRASISEEEYIRREIILEKTNQIRMVASDQFFGVSGMLEDLAFEFDEAEIFNSSASNRIRKLLGEKGVYPQSISAIEDKYGRIRVEILSDGDISKLDNPELKNEIGKICSRYFDSGIITNFKNETMLSFFERPNYTLKTGFAQHSAEGKYCGDTVKTINDSKGHSILIISDGMGKGSRAALDGAMGAELLSKLLNAGFGFDSALKVVNCALLVKSNDESLATLDIANIDLFTGKCEIFKAGAPASYIIKGKHITKCELSSMPAGILRGIEFAKRTAVLKPDDVIILLSDGISELGDEWLYKTLSAQSPLGVQETAQYILSEALKKSEGTKIDDMSVIYARLERN